MDYLRQLFKRLKSKRTAAASKPSPYSWVYGGGKSPQLTKPFLKSRSKPPPTSTGPPLTTFWSFNTPSQDHPYGWVWGLDDEGEEDPAA